ncbi:MAG TPA: nucleoside triphosphate pyrophosphohydrolase, partial [Bacteroidetes bacterium]|nr:nucleoside triphosphate pyrophosphohydrolase [Bacteroidota bacterium]
KFKLRFEAIEAYANTNSLKWEEMSLAQMDEVWNEAKKNHL